MSPVPAGLPTFRSAAPAAAVPPTLYAYLWRFSGRHQIALSVIAVIIFVMSMAPLELQRRIVNGAIGGRDPEALVLLCAAYAGLALAMGATKLGLNVYRGYVGETATLDLRRRVHASMGSPAGDGDDDPIAADTAGTEIAMVISEVEPVGGFIGISISEPLLQGGILATVFGYMVFLQPWMALTSIVLFMPQLVFVPLMQREINRRAARRIRAVREVSARLVEQTRHESGNDGEGGNPFLRRIADVFSLNMQIFRWKFSMNFLMNGTYHIGVTAILLVGGGLVIDGRTELGTVVAFISGLAQLNDPWGDLVNYFRESTTAQMKYRLIADALAREPGEG